MKKIIISLLLITHISCFSQIKIDDEPTQNKVETESLSELKIPATYNGAISGYANVCQLDQENIIKFETYYYEQLNQFKLTFNQLQLLINEFNETKQTIIKTKTKSKSNCDQFSKEFDKILKQIIK